MVGRFIDNDDFVKEAKIFAHRDHGTPLWWAVVSFLLTSILLFASVELLKEQNFIYSFAIISIIMLSLFSVIAYFLLKDKEAINTIEFQNAIFSEMAKLTSEFCIIIKYDGSILYITPEYAKKILKDKRDQKPNITLLKKHGFINGEELSKLQRSLEGGKRGNINMNISNDSPLVSFLLDPINIFHKNDSRKKINLASKGFARPSGYFLLRAPKTALEENRTTMRELSFGNYVIDKENKICFANRTFDRILGYDEGEILEKEINFEKLFINSSELDKLQNCKKEYQSVINLYKKDGQQLTVFISHKVNKGSASKAFGIITPVINEKIIPQKDEALNSGSYNLLENSPIATAIINSDSKIERSNKPFSAMLAGLPAKYKKNGDLLDVITPDSKPGVKNLLKKATKTQTDNTKAVDIKLNGDGETAASLYISSIADDKYIVHMIDTTELKNLEMRFVHSQKMQAVGQLAGGIAHDFNNLLTAMMGFCDLLLMKHPAGDQSFADIMQIKQNANRAANLVRQLLAFSRKQTLQPEIINITDVLADLTNLIGRLIGENIELKMMHGRDLGNVKVDQGQLEQVIINLAVNARDAMTDGGILTISTENCTVDKNYKIAKNMTPPAEDEIIEEGEYILISVEDTGMGIKKEDLGNIFEPFFSTKEVGAGTGLGLSTVYGIIKQTDGFIYVSSTIGKGTKFSIFLRRYDDPKDIKIKKDDHHHEKALTDLNGQGLILLVEDETPVRIFSKSALVSKGYTVLEADCAEAALETFAERGNDIDIIITDVVMPGISGPDMIKQIYENHPEMKVIFISGYGEDAFVESFGEERKFNFLSKPYTLKQLATKVKEVIEE